MRLYSTISSERESREVKKGGNEYMKIDLYDGNRNVYRIHFYGHGRIMVSDHEGYVLIRQDDRVPF